MIGITAGIAVLFSALGITRTTMGAALGVLVFSMFIWPEFLRVPLGMVQMSVPRFLAVFLLIKLMFFSNRRSVALNKVDLLVIAVWIWTVFATVVASAEFSQVTQMIGRGLDTVLMYFIGRMAFTKPVDVQRIYKWLALTAIVMCIAGVYEAFTWSSPYHRLSGGAARIDMYSEVRLGMLRAQASTLNSIYFGMAMMIVSGVLWSLRGFVGSGFKFKLILFASGLAALTSLASGPWIGMILLVILNLYIVRPSLIKPSILLFIALAALLEIASNRHFYHLIDYLALDSRTAWYRTRLLEVAVSQWPDYWLVGVGSNWPHHWAQLLDGRAHIDVVNNFIIIALYGGLPALVLVIWAHVSAVLYSVKAFRSDQDGARRKLLFGLGATFIALDISSLSVGLFGPALLLSNILLGMYVGVSVGWTKQGETHSRTKAGEFADSPT